MEQNISIDFEESVAEWLNYVNNQKGKQFFSKTTIMPIKKILCLIQSYLVNDKNVNQKEVFDILDFIEYAKKNNKVVEEAFYNIFKPLVEKLLPSSLRVYASCGRKALAEMGLNKKFLKLPAKKQKEIHEDVSLLPPKIRSLDDKNELKIFFIDRLKHLKQHNKINSAITIKNMLRYWGHVAEIFKVTEDKSFLQQDFSVNNIVNLIKDPTNHQIIDIFHMFEGYNEEWNNMTIKKLKEHYPKSKKKDAIIDDDKDHHRLSAKQQEDILKACETPFETLLVALLFTTGMRVSGIRMIKLKDICDKTSNPITIFEYGKTCEKGNKVRTFPIMKMVKEPLIQWINSNHMIDSDYLFPSQRISSQPITVLNFQNCFKKIAKRAGYEGKEIHVHSARHSVAFNLLESGNSMDKIGKFLGHANPATTAKFYAKLSTKETVNRMDTTCIGGENKLKTHKPDIPNFNKTEKKHKKKNNLSKLKDIVINIK